MILSYILDMSNFDQASLLASLKAFDHDPVFHKAHLYNALSLLHESLPPHSWIGFYLYDERDSTTQEVIAFVKEFYREDLKIVLVHNKVDLTNQETPNSFDATLNQELFPDFCDELLRISAKDQTGIEAVKTVLIDYVENLKDEESNVIITNQRHFDALQKSLQSVLQVEHAVSSGIHTELLAYELRNALEQLGEISGEFTNDEVLGNIFSKFCIGK